MISLLLFISSLSVAQDTIASIKDQHLLYGNDKWSDYLVASRLGFGIQAYQNTGFLEFGISREKFYWEGYHFGAMGQYLAIEFWGRNSNSEFYGNKRPYSIKVGFEGVKGAATLPLAYGFELKYLTDFNNHDIHITPKIGSGLIGEMFFFYAYNFSLNNNAVHHLGGHQISWVFNLNRYYITGKVRKSRLKSKFEKEQKKLNN